MKNMLLRNYVVTVGDEHDPFNDIDVGGANSNYWSSRELIAENVKCCGADERI